MSSRLHTGDEEYLLADGNCGSTACSLISEGYSALCRGGIVFAATQALGWGLFSGSLLCLIYLVTTAARGMAYCIRCWIFATGSVMLASQLVSPSRLSLYLQPALWSMTSLLWLAERADLRLGMKRHEADGCTLHCIVVRFARPMSDLYGAVPGSVHMDVQGRHQVGAERSAPAKGHGSGCSQTLQHLVPHPDDVSLPRASCSCLIQLDT